MAPPTPPQPQPPQPPQPLTKESVLAEELQQLRGVAPAAWPPSGEVPAWVQAAHAQAEPLTALCISGGGIRSATFGLGGLQGLAEAGLLQRFDYLSTVSGGGYIGSWLSAWARRAGLAAASDGLSGKNLAPGDSECQPIAHLRAYNNYLTPRLGALSLDSWTLAVTILRNLLLNWLVLIPLLMASLMLPWWYALFIEWGVRHKDLHDWLGVPAVLLFVFALFNSLRYLPSVAVTRYSGGDYLRKVGIPLMLAVLLYLGTAAVESSLLEEVSGRLWPCGVALALYLALYWKRVLQLGGLLALAGPVVLMAVGVGVTSYVCIDLLHLQATSFKPQDSGLQQRLFVTFAPPLQMLGLLVGNVLFVGLSSRSLKDEDREWLSRSMGLMLMFCIFWTLGCSIVLLAPLALKADAIATWGPSALAAASAFSGWATAFGHTLLAAREPPPGQPRKAWSLAALALKAAPGVFILALMAGLSCAVNAALGGDYQFGGLSLQLILVVPLTLLLMAWFFVLGRYINPNTFSLHGMYRDRLIRAYLGASNPNRQANGFTGFSATDNVRMHQLVQRPLHIVNTTLNLVQGERLAWQQRKAQPFSISPLHCGNHDLGYRPAAQYGGADGISLGTAMAISGAAASPSMGANTGAVSAFIMTLLNARLGAWLGNPAIAGAKTWQLAGPKASPIALMREALGLTGNEKPYVYLSDGGHFENLGLYEMVLRRCRRIVVLDAGCDPDLNFDDLGNALRKIRIDLGISIDFGDGDLQALRAGQQRSAQACIRYTATDGAGSHDGQLLYIKPLLRHDEPPDVDNYARMHPDFPHESTSNQWFSESQTESYRMLGLLSMRAALERSGAALGLTG